MNNPQNGNEEKENLNDIKVEIEVAIMEMKEVIDKFSAISEQLSKIESTDTQLIETPDQELVNEVIEKTIEEEAQPEPMEKEPVSEEEKPKPDETGCDLVKPAPFKSDNFGIDEVKFGQKWLLIAGVIIVVFAVGYFLKYAAERNWINPTARVISAYIWGGAFLFGGNKARKNWSTFGLIIIGGGIATFYLSTYSAFSIYKIMGQTSAFGLMVLTTILAGVLSVLYSNKWLAVLGIIGGFLTPVLLSTNESNQIVLMTYMLILNGGVVFISFHKQWKLLNYLACAATWILFSTWMFGKYHIDAFWTTTIFLNLFFLTHNAIPFLYHLKNEDSQNVSGIATIVPNSFIAFGFSYFIIQEKFSIESIAIVSLSYAFISIAMASALFKLKRVNQKSFAVLLIQASIFLAITVPIMFSGHWITVFWAVEGAGFIYLSNKIKSPILKKIGIGALAFATMKMITYDYVELFEFKYDVFDMGSRFFDTLISRIISGATVLISLWVSSIFTRSEKDQSLSIFFKSTFTVILFILLNLEISSLFHTIYPDAQFVAITVLWTMFALSLMIIGFIHNLKIIRKVSITLFAITIGKLFLVDMANVTTPFRILSFVVLGLMLIGSSFLYHKYRHVILPEEDKGEES